MENGPHIKRILAAECHLHTVITPPPAHLIKCEARVKLGTQSCNGLKGISCKVHLNGELM